jgi:hypothetical protein
MICNVESGRAGRGGAANIGRLSTSSAGSIDAVPIPYRRRSRH